MKIMVEMAGRFFKDEEGATAKVEFLIKAYYPK